MRNPTFGSAAALVLLTMLGGCGQADKPTVTEQASTSPSPSATPDDVSLNLPPTEQVVLTYSDRDAVNRSSEVKVGRNYALYTRCRGGAVHVELQDMQGSRPWFAPCDGMTNRMLLADGPRSITVFAGGTAGTRWTFAVVNLTAGTK
ncbi:hypothetical protein [Kribbella sp. NPDC051770]|uniref:hypothetical protein n=1 Tax=Kribbella sp. NPDC051770 TaxID=3155413 RepID=UPI00343DAE92